MDLKIYKQACKSLHELESSDISYDLMKKVATLTKAAYPHNTNTDVYPGYQMTVYFNKQKKIKNRIHYEILKILPNHDEDIRKDMFYKYEQKFIIDNMCFKGCDYLETGYLAKCKQCRTGHYVFEECGDKIAECGRCYIPCSCCKCKCCFH